MDLGADGWQTFRFVTLPMIATALVAGALLAFAPSFDEIVVTTFTAGAQSTLPIWILGNIRLGQQLPQVNVVVLFVIVITLIPITLAQRLTRGTGLLRGKAAEGAVPERRVGERGLAAQAGNARRGKLRAWIRDSSRRPISTRCASTRGGILRASTSPGTRAATAPTRA
jgi:hypothetical protein